MIFKNRIDKQCSICYDDFRYNILVEQVDFKNIVDKRSNNGEILLVKLTRIIYFHVKIFVEN